MLLVLLLLTRIGIDFVVVVVVGVAAVLSIDEADDDESVVRDFVNLCKEKNTLYLKKKYCLFQMKEQKPE